VVATIRRPAHVVLASARQLRRIRDTYISARTEVSIQPRPPTRNTPPPVMHIHDVATSPQPLSSLLRFVQAACRSLRRVATLPLDPRVQTRTRDARVGIALQRW
jgi:hypothetical protein